jgi:hypothetical protein
MLDGPLVWVVWHVLPAPAAGQHPGVWHSHPVVFEPAVLQFE